MPKERYYNDFFNKRPEEWSITCYLNYNQGKLKLPSALDQWPKSLRVIRESTCGKFLPLHKSCAEELLLRYQDVRLFSLSFFFLQCVVATAGSVDLSCSSSRYHSRLIQTTFSSSAISLQGWSGPVADDHFAPLFPRHRVLVAAHIV
ncbi:hypothetical protein L873DRAFT_880382 [Choiromyces venosus 120613-1]|uniref:Uncharacterized protein n=1 Tax=Choiromyces venosus 120613-1 TaxID=1336337 RepID=A0A3N4K1H2_9PEZI|nr:hypothetical protein L873DRAFT_880382 [Choiromyces venosus 120613-1]